MKSSICLLLSFIVVFFMCCQSSSDAHIEHDHDHKRGSSTENIPSFEPEMEAHLQGVVNRDIDAYTKALPKNDNITMIFPSGRLLENSKTITDTHVNWFSDTTWTFNYTYLKKEQINNIGFALLDVNLLEQTMESTDTTKFYLSLLFKYDNDSWKLLHDQCTIHD